MNDPVLKSLFLGAGAQGVAIGSPVKVVAPAQRANAVYPTGVVDGEENDQMKSGEGLPKFFTGRLRIEWRTRLTEDDRDHLLTLMQLRTRAKDLVLGKQGRAGGTYNLPGKGAQAIPADSESLTTLLGQRIGPNYQVVTINQINPTRTIPTDVETIAAHLTTYEVMLSRWTL